MVLRHLIENCSIRSTLDLKINRQTLTSVEISENSHYGGKTCNRMVARAEKFLDAKRKRGKKKQPGKSPGPNLEPRLPTTQPQTE